MTLIEFLFLLGAGSLLTWLLQISRLLRPIWNLHLTLKELSECDLCLGFWVYLGLSFGIDSHPFGLCPYWFEVIILSTLCAFFAHLLRIGWLARFGTTIVG